MWALFNILGADGHFLPMVPLARALQEGGHEVTFLTGAAYCPTVERRGFAAIAVGGSALVGGEERRAAVQALRGDERLRFQYAGKAGMLTAAVPHARAIVDVCDRRMPDVLVRETTAFGAWMAGELLDLPVASFDFNPRPAGQFASVLGDHFQAVRAEMGLAPDEQLASLDRWLTILGGPPGWFPSEVFRPTTHLFQPPEDLSADDRLPAWFDTLPQRANVYVTFGTAGNRTPGLFEMVFEAVADLDANVIVTVGRTIDPAGYGPLPDHVHVEQFISQGALLPNCDAVIAHGGYGSLMGTLRHGLPVVTVPLQAADNHTNATRVEQLGAGIAVTEDERSVDKIRDAVVAILNEPRFRAASRKVGAEMAELPPFVDSVRLIERLATDRQPVLAR